MLLTTLSIACASASAFPTSNKHPNLLSFTTSANPSILLATHGIPAAAASTATIPNPSNLDGTTNTSAFASKDGTSETFPNKKTFSSNPYSRIFDNIC